MATRRVAEPARSRNGCCWDGCGDVRALAPATYVRVNSTVSRGNITCLTILGFGLSGWSYLQLLLKAIFCNLCVGYDYTYGYSLKYGRVHSLPHNSGANSRQYNTAIGFVGSACYVRLPLESRLLYPKVRPVIVGPAAILR